MQIILDSKAVSAELGETIFDVAQREGIEVPALCRHPELKPLSTSCLVCLVKVDGRFVPSCATDVAEGMNIESETEEVHAMRRSALELLLSDHIAHCRTCGEGRKKCRLLKYMAKYKANRHRFKNAEASEPPADHEPQTPENEAILQSDRVVFDPRKCIKCGLCVAITRKSGEEIGLTFLGRGFDTHVGVPFDEPLQRVLERSADKSADKSAGESAGELADDIVSTCPTAALTWR